MLGNAKVLKRNNWECKGVLIGPSFFSTTRFRHNVFRSLTKSRSRLRAQILRRGWHADVTHECARPELVVRLGHSSGGISSTSRDLSGSGCSRNHFYGNAVSLPTRRTVAATTEEAGEAEQVAEVVPSSVVVELVDIEVAFEQ